MKAASLLRKVGLTLSLAVVATALSAVSFPQSAQAADGQPCLGITCYASSTQSGTSTWSQQNGGGKTATGGSIKSNYSTTFQKCGYWLPPGGGQSSNSYPDPRKGAHNCYLGGGGFGGGSGDVGLTCSASNNRSPYGSYRVYFNDAGTKRYLYSYCAYPSNSSYNPVSAKVNGNGKVYTGGQATFYINGTQAAQAQKYNGGGTSISTTGYKSRGADLNNPPAWTGPFSVNHTAQTKSTNGIPDYGYYRMDTFLDYRICTQYAYPSWMKIPVYYSCSANQREYQVQPYTYSCSFNPALRTGIVAGAKFNPSSCTSSQWSCVVTGPITVNGTAADQAVMRDNRINPTKLAAISTNSGGIVRNVQPQMYLSLDEKKVSPWSPYTTNDANHAKQYFNSKDMNGKATLQFNAWQNAKTDATVSFIWSSEAGKRWWFNQTGRISAQFYVPTQEGMKWVQDTGSCAGSVRSPLIEVLRSVNG